MMAKSKPPVRTWRFAIAGYGEAEFVERTLPKARMAAFHALCAANDRLTFKQFLSMARASAVPNAPPVGSRITVCGQPAVHCGLHGQHTRFFYADADGPIMVAHPSEVGPG